MKGLILASILFLGLTSVVSSMGFQSRDEDDEDSGSSWRTDGGVSSEYEKSESFNTAADPSSWRLQKKREYKFPSIEYSKLPFFSLFKKKNKKPDDGSSKTTSIGDDVGEQGVVTCPPEFKKCLPRLGR